MHESVTNFCVLDGTLCPFLLEAAILDHNAKVAKKGEIDRERKAKDQLGR